MRSCLCEENICVLRKKDGLIWSTTQQILELDWNHMALYKSDFLKIVKAWLQCNYSQASLYSDAEILVKQFSPKSSLSVALWYFGYFQSEFLHFARQVFLPDSQILFCTAAFPLLSRMMLTILFICPLFWVRKIFSSVLTELRKYTPFSMYSARVEN